MRPGQYTLMQLLKRPAAVGDVQPTHICSSAWTAHAGTGYSAAPRLKEHLELSKG